MDSGIHQNLANLFFFSSLFYKILYFGGTNLHMALWIWQLITWGLYDLVKHSGTHHAGNNMVPHGSLGNLGHIEFLILRNGQNKLTSFFPKVVEYKLYIYK